MKREPEIEPRVVLELKAALFAVLFSANDHERCRGVVVKPRPQTPGETYMERLMRDLGRSLNRPVKRMPRDAESVHQLLTKWKTFDDKVKVICSLEVLAYLFAKYSEMPNSLDKTQYLASIERQMKRISESE